jgi:hypothetical protein
MASGKEPADPSPVTPLPAAERGEHWWPVALAIIAVVGLHVALPAKYRVNPSWVVPVVLLGLLAALIIGDPGPHRPAEYLAAGRHRRRHCPDDVGEPGRRRPPRR